MQNSPAAKKGKGKNAQLVILEHDHNQRMWYRNLAKKVF